MQTRIVNRHVRRQWTAFGVLVAISVVMMLGSGTGVAREVQGAFNFALAPIEQGINGAADTVGSYWRAFSEIDQLRVQNDELRRENESLRQQLARMPAISHLNDDWTAITQTQEFIPYRTTPAQVIIRDNTDLRPRTIVIDKGSRDGIVSGQVVVAAGGALVGRVSWTAPTVSQILLINDTGSTVVGREEQTGATGPVQGQQGGLLVMTQIDTTYTLLSGQQVVTAGQGIPGTDIRSPYPPGLLIGSVVDIHRDANAVQQSAYLQAAIDFNVLDYVLVITNYQGGIPTPSPSPLPGTSPTPTPHASPSASHGASPGPSRTPAR